MAVRDKQRETDALEGNTHQNQVETVKTDTLYCEGLNITIKSLSWTFDGPVPAGGRVPPRGAVPSAPCEASRAEDRPTEHETTERTKYMLK